MFRMAILLASILLLAGCSNYYYLNGKYYKVTPAGRGGAVYGPDELGPDGKWKPAQLDDDGFDRLLRNGRVLEDDEISSVVETRRCRAGITCRDQGVGSGDGAHKPPSGKKAGPKNLIEFDSGD